MLFSCAYSDNILFKSCTPRLVEVSNAEYYCSGEKAGTGESRNERVMGYVQWWRWYYDDDV
jgi:hypothetical protein